MRRRTADLPLHGGHAPPWLFQRMVRLAGAVTMAVTDAYGPRGMLARLADPGWFQSFGCLLGFDWHSSGLTTVVCGALGEASKRYGDELGLCVAGGKASAGRRAPEQIARACDRLGSEAGPGLIHASRMSAKVDSNAVQDGYRVYHHSFFFAPDGGWCVVQQGLPEAGHYARRYHWHGADVTDFVCEPHYGIGVQGEPAGDCLNMVAAESAESREAATALLRGRLDWLAEQAKRWTEGPSLFAPAAHPVPRRQIDPDRIARLGRLAQESPEGPPNDFAGVLGLRGAGPAAVRSLALLAELIYEAPVARRDPATSKGRRLADRYAEYAFAHGGKDGHPHPVDLGRYDRDIAVLERAVREARVGENARAAALERLGAAARSAEA